MKVYYNENDPFAADWLEALIADGQLPRGFVDRRDIREVAARNLEGFSQCHFFAGIGGWPYALRLAGWPDDRSVWTGSCPCQPFSNAGKRKGIEDERHLWPAFRELIAQCRPPTIFGEQVASKAGREWLAGVRADMEVLAYGIGAADLCAPGVGAPQNGPRLYWVATTDSNYFPKQNSISSFPLETSRRNNPRGCGCSFWSSSIEVEGEDRTRRRIEPSIYPLANGLPNRVAIQRGGSNAIVPQLAAEFIGAFIDIAPQGKD